MNPVVQVIPQFAKDTNMTKAVKDFFSNFVVAFAGAVIATTVFLLGKNLIVNHQFGFAVTLLLSVLIYTLTYSFLFALLHIGGSATLGTTGFAACLMVVGTNIIIFADEKFAGFTVGVAFSQLVLAWLLSSTTYLFVVVDRPMAVGKS